MKNESGIQPFEFRVLVKPEKKEQKTSGGIYIPDEAHDKEKMAVKVGQLVAVGALAFTEPDWLDKPWVGDWVVFDRYAGAIVEGQDGEEYRLMNDKEIGGSWKK